MVLGYEWHKNQVHMVRHYHSDEQPHFLAVIMQTVLQHEITGQWWQFASLVRIEGEKMSPS